MDPQSDAATLEALSRRSSHARLVLERQAHAFREQWSLANQLKKSVQKHPSAWFIGSLLSGITLSRILRRTPTRATAAGAPAQSRRPESLPKKLLLSGFKLAQPAVTAWLGQQVQQRLNKQLSQRENSR